MIRPRPVTDRIRFDGFEADLRTEELFRSGRKVRLPHQSFLVLATLLERAGQLVTREELRARVWPAGTQVEYDQGLNAVVKRLRGTYGTKAGHAGTLDPLATGLLLVLLGRLLGDSGRDGALLAAADQA